MGVIEAHASQSYWEAEWRNSCRLLRVQGMLFRLPFEEETFLGPELELHRPSAALPEPSKLLPWRYLFPKEMKVWRCSTHLWDVRFPWVWPGSTLPFLSKCKPAFLCAPIIVDHAQQGQMSVTADTACHLSEKTRGEEHSPALGGSAYLAMVMRIAIVFKSLSSSLSRLESS